MRKTGLRRFKAIICLIMALTIVCSVIALSACTDGKKVTAISIDEGSVSGYYAIEEFDISSIRLNVTYEDESSGTIAAAKSMLTTEAINSLKEPGQKSITINYKGQSAIVELYLVADGSEIVCVTFNSYGGTELAKRYALVGGSVVAPQAPEVAGQRFLGWVDSKGDEVDLTKVSESATVTASYSVISASYTVTFADHKGKTLKTLTTAAGGKVTANDVPKVRTADYPEITSNIGWTESFPYTVQSDVTIKLVPEYKMCSVLFAFATESDPTGYTYNSALRTSVRYGTDVKDGKTRMEAYLAENGYEVVRVNRTDTVIKEDGTVEFIYIVRDASVAIKVYSDEGKNKPLDYSSPVRTGTELSLPKSTDAEPVAGYAVSGWKIKGGEGETIVGIDIGKWTVDKSFGMSVEITPVYTPLTVNVNFSFDFKDEKLTDDDSKTYVVSIAVNNRFAEGDAVTYQFIDDLLKNIAENKSDYQKLLRGETVSNASLMGKPTDNSSSAMKKAFDNIELYGIISVTVGGARLRPGQAKTVLGRETSFDIAVSASTPGVIYRQISEGETVKGYAVSGIKTVKDDDNDTDVYPADANIYIPDYHDGKPILEIDANALERYNVTRLPERLTSIGNFAFKYSVIYGEINLSALEKIGNEAFAYSTLYAGNVRFPAITELGDSAFAYATADGTAFDFGSGLTRIGERAFGNAKGVESVKLAATVTEIGDYAFYQTEISSITTLEGVESVGMYAFSETSLAEIDMPAVREIGTGAFSNIETLGTVKIGGAAATRAAGLTFDFADLDGSINLTEVSLGASVEGIALSVSGMSRFGRLTAINVAAANTRLYSDKGVLYSVNGSDYTLEYYPNDKIGNYKAALPQGAQLSLKASAFSNAVVAVLDLTGVTVKEFNGTVSSVYAACVSESDIAEATETFDRAIVGVSNAQGGFEVGYDEEYKLVYQVVEVVGVGEAVTVLGGYRNAVSITVPEKIGGRSINLIAPGAFRGYTALETLDIRATLGDWSASVIDGDYALRSFDVKGWNKGVSERLTIDSFRGNGWFNRNNVIKVGGTLFGYNDNAAINGRPITVVDAEDAGVYFAGDGIPAGFFSGCVNFTYISLPESVKIIGDGAFKNCRNLESFSAKALTSVGKEVFAGCVALTEVVLNFSGESAIMSEGAFGECTELRRAVINGKVNGSTTNGVNYYSLPARTFYKCAKLTEVKLEYINCFAKIGGESNAFSGCSSLAEFDFTKLVGSEIPANTFANCSSLQYAILNSPGLTTIGVYAFGSCTALRYVIFGSSVTTVEDSAFDGCSGLVVELSYDDGGLYGEKASVGAEAFENDAIFFISQQILRPNDVDFLRGRDYRSSYPLIGFELTSASKGMQINFAMTDIHGKVFLTDNDVVAPVFNGFIFAGWYADEDEATEITFPTVRTENSTIYAKYYDGKQGSIDATSDIKYVYYLTAEPSVDLDSDEAANWHYIKNGGSQNSISSFPLVLEAAKGDEFEIILTVTVKGTDRVVYSKSYGDCGELGYAIVGYSGMNRDRISIPDTYDDGENGTDEIILIYAGAFRNCISSEFQIPRNVKAILTGNGTKEKDFGLFEANTTFGSDLKYVTVTNNVEYIADGVFTNPNIEEIVFEENSKLVYAGKGAFFGSTWWNKELERACTETNGFIVAGRLAVKFVGKADVVLLPVESPEIETTKKFGFKETDEEFELTVTIYYNDGGEISKDVKFRAMNSSDEGVYVFDIAVDIDNDGNSDLVGSFALNTTDSETWEYNKGRNLLIITGFADNAIAFSIGTKDSDAFVPAKVIKLGDGIFKNNSAMESVTLTSDIVAIGNEAFLGSGLKTVRYGDTNGDQYKTDISYIGKDAFYGTDWYRTEKVILGRTFLKYNNVSGSSIVTITEMITKIAPEAFKGAAVLSTVTVSSTVLEEIGAFAFKSSNISSLTLPKSVKKLGRGVFENCIVLKSIVLSETAITELPDMAFYGDRNLQTLVLPASVTRLGDNSLEGCVRLESITANGVREMNVNPTNGQFACGLEETKWYNPAVSEDDQDDVCLVIGKVFVKYIVGKKNRKIYEEKYDLEGKGELKIKLPENITLIAYKAFSDPSTGIITEIEIPKSVTEIGISAFEGCSNLVTVQIGDSVEKIGSRAFYNLSKLKNAILPEGLISIGDYAFFGTGLTTEVCDSDGIRISDDGYPIPGTVTEIGEYAFAEVPTLTYITLGTSVVKIGRGAFATAKNGQSNLYKVGWNLEIKGKEYIQPDGTLYQELSQIQKLTKHITENSINGSGIFTTANDKTIRFYSTKETAEFVADVTKFESASTWTNDYGWIFYETGTLPTVTPAGNGYTLAPFAVEYIKDGDIGIPVHNTVSGATYTFMYWINADTGMKLVYPYVVTADMKIDAVFYHNEAEKGVEDDMGVKFTTREDTVYGVGRIAIITNFEIPADTDTLYIPNKIGGVPVTAFKLNSADDKIKKLVITNAENFNGMTVNIFTQFTALESIVLEYAGFGAVDYKVVRVNVSALSGDKTYTAPFYALYSNDTSAGSGYGTKLIALIGNVETATRYARDTQGYDYARNGLLDFMFTVPEGVNEIYEGAFVNSGLKSVSLPSTVTVIGDGAFGNLLTTMRVAKGINITSITKNAIPSSAPIMSTASGGQNATTLYTEIKGFKYEYKRNKNGQMSFFGNFYAIANVLVGYETTVGEYEDEIGFELPPSVNGISITVIASEIYGGSTTLRISTISLPSGLSKINADAFRGMNFYDVRNAEGYESLRDIASNVFDDTNYYKDNSSALYVGKVLVKWSNYDGSRLKDGTIAIASGAFRGSSLTSITIPDTVTSIGDEAFYSVDSLVEVIIPSSVTKIGNRAFMLCTGLKRVTFSDIENSNLNSIGVDAFRSDRALETLSLPASLDKIGNNAFMGCNSLLSVTFDSDGAGTSSLTDLGSSAFSGATKLTTVSIPSGITEIKESTFENCSSLVSVEFARNSKLTDIEARAFGDCVALGSIIDKISPNLITVRMPDSLVNVGQNAFMNCSGMWGISFGHNLASLAEGAFSGCINLAKVEMKRATAPSITNTTFDLANKKNRYRLRIYVQGDYEEKIKTTYVEKWQSTWSAPNDENCANFIYQSYELPTVVFTRTDSANKVYEERVTADVLYYPSYSVSGGDRNAYWQYQSFKQGGVAVDVDRTGDYRKYGAQTIDMSDGENKDEWYFLVIDYDEIVMAPSNRGDE